MMCKILLLLAFAQLVYSGASYNNLDEYLQYVAGLSPEELQKENHRLEDAVKELAEKYRPNISAGFPALNITILDPLKLGDVSLEGFQFGKNAEFGFVNFHNALLKGLKDFILSDAQISVNNLEFRLNITIPNARIEGNHEINGTMIGEMPIQGEGTFFVGLQNFVVRTEGSVKAENGHFSMENFDITLDVGEIDLQFDGLDGDKYYTAGINRNLKRIAKGLFKRDGSKLGKLAAEKARQPINEFLKAIDIDALLAGAVEPAAN